MKKQEYPVTKRWKSLTVEQQIEEVRAAMAQRHTNKSAAKLLGTTPGTVAGIRHRNEIPALSKKSAENEAQPKPARSTNVIEQTRAQEQPTAPTIKPKPEKTVRRVMAASEHTQCKHVYKDKHRCGFEKEPGSDYCGRKHED